MCQRLRSPDYRVHLENLTLLPLVFYSYFPYTRSNLCSFFINKFPIFTPYNDQLFNMGL